MCKSIYKIQIKRKRRFDLANNKRKEVIKIKRLVIALVLVAIVASSAFAYYGYVGPGYQPYWYGNEEWFGNWSAFW